MAKKRFFRKSDQWHLPIEAQAFSSADVMDAVVTELAPEEKTPRTERGRRTLRKLIDAAAAEFGERGFHEASITGITRRAGTALGSFYTYFNSKDEIFRALVEDLSGRLAEASQTAHHEDLSARERERHALVQFLHFARENKEIYRIVDQCEFVDPGNFRDHYSAIADRILERLREGAARGAFRADVNEVHAWAIMGMSHMLGLRYSAWADNEDLDHIGDLTVALLFEGIGPR